MGLLRNTLASRVPRRQLLAGLGGLAGAAALLSVPWVTSATPAATATVRFGMPHTGSPFPPPEEHDHSANAIDNLVPRTVTIAAGGSVTYQIAPPHQVAIYRPGTTPDDITLSDATLDDLAVPFPPFTLPNFLINDPNGRIALGPPPSFTTAQTWTTPAGTFSQPGRYFVMCTLVPHFQVNMNGWVIVQ